MAEKKKSGFFGKLVKWGLIAGVVLGALVLAAPFFINWKDVKDKATAYLSRTLHHKVSIDSITVSLFEGVSINKLTIANAAGFGSQPLFYNEKAVLRPSLLSIFTGKIVISEIEFKNPKVLVEKNANGAFNFSDMSGPSQAAPAAAGAKSEAGAPPNVVVASFKLTGGDLTYRDKGKDTAIKGLDILLRGFSLKAGGNSRLELKFTAELEGKKIPLSLSSNFNLDLGGQKLHLSSLDFDAPSLNVGVKGDISEFLGDPRLEISVHADAKLDGIVDGLVPPSTLAAMPKGLKASGGIRLDAGVKGKVSQPQNFDVKADLKFKDVGIKSADAPAVEGMNGTFSIGPTKSSLPALSFKMGGSPVTLGLELGDYTVKGLMGPKDAIRLNVRYSLTSPKLVVEPLMAYAAIPDTDAEIAEKKAENARNGGMKDYRSKISKGITVHGSIKVDSIHYKEITTGALTHVLELRNQRMKSTLDVKLFDGTLWNHLEADLSVPGPRHTFRAVLSKLQIEKAVNAAAASFPDKPWASQLKGKVQGSLSFDVSGSGKGSQAPALNKNLFVDGNFGMKDGVIKKLDVQEKLASAIPHPATQEVLRKDIPFGQMGGHINLKNEKVTLTDFFLSSGADHRQGELLIQASGYQVLGGALDFKVTPRFNPRVVKLDGVLADGFNDEMGWATYNYISYRGANSKEARADYLQGAKAAARKIVDKKVEEVKKQAQSEVKRQAEEKGKDLIKQLPGNLKGLFGQ